MLWCFAPKNFTIELLMLDIHVLLTKCDNLKIMKLISLRAFKGDSNCYFLARFRTTSFNTLGILINWFEKPLKYF